jgi:hypothetical protein
VQDHVQQRTVNLQLPIVFDKAQFAEFVHEKAHTRSRRADHFRQRLLTYLSHDRLRSPFLAEVRQEKEHSSKAPFAGIEQLIDQILFNSAVASQEVRYEHFRKFRFIMERGDHGRLCYASNHAFSHRGARCNAQNVAIQAAFAKKISRSQNGDYGFPSLLGNNRDLELSLLEVKDRVRDVALREDDLILLVFGYRLSVADLGEEPLGVERCLAILSHSSSLDVLRASRMRDTGVAR